MIPVKKKHRIVDTKFSWGKNNGVLQIQKLIYNNFLAYFYPFITLAFLFLKISLMWHPILFQIQQSLTTAEKTREAKLKDVKEKQRIREERAKRAREKVTYHLYT